ncbi:MAG TPA: hypothetical protein VN959_17665 [Mycobacterium sp.]|nr:hypothetical protein [Mycobacterium sp.]
MVSSQAMMATARLVDLSATAAALWLAAITLLALLVIYFVGIDQGAVSAGLLRRNERAYTGSSAVR